MLFLWKLPLISCVDCGSYSLEASEHEWIESSYALVSLGTYIGGGYMQGSFDGVQFYMTLLYLFRPLIRKGQVHFPWGLPEHFVHCLRGWAKPTSALTTKQLRIDYSCPRLLIYHYPNSKFPILWKLLQQYIDDIWMLACV